MNIQPIVEGHGELAAIPVLVRRLRDVAQAYPVDVNPPIRRHRSDFFNEVELKKAIRLALKQEHCDAILIVFDGDGGSDCPKEDGPRILTWAATEAAGKPCAVVMAYREYEAWFLASIESLRGRRGIRPDADSHPQPELPRGAKEQLEQRMQPGESYQETADQPALSAVFDMRPAYQKCRSFRHLVEAFGDLLAASGIALPVWPPAAWIESQATPPGAE
jgi:hypothetical protein